MGAAGKNELTFLVVATGASDGAGAKRLLYATLIATPSKISRPTRSPIGRARWPSTCARSSPPPSEPDPAAVRGRHNSAQRGLACETAVGGRAGQNRQALVPVLHQRRPLPQRAARAALPESHGARARVALGIPANGHRRNVGGKKQTPPGTGLAGGYPNPPAAENIDASGALNAPDFDPAAHTLTINSLVANTQTAYAVEVEAARAQRVVRKLMIGPYLPGDPADWETQQAKGVARASAGSACPSDGRHAGQRRRNAQGGLRPAHGRRDRRDERRARGLAKSVPSRRRGGTVTTRPPAIKSTVAPAGQIGGAAVDPNAQPRAAHVYAAWPQQSKRYRTPQRGSAPPPDLETTDDVQARISPGPAPAGGGGRGPPGGLVRAGEPGGVKRLVRAVAQPVAANRCLARGLEPARPQGAGQAVGRWEADRRTRGQAAERGGSGGPAAAAEGQEGGREQPALEAAGRPPSKATAARRAAAEPRSGYACAGLGGTEEEEGRVTFLFELTG